MPGPSIDDIQAALNDYKAKTDTMHAKRTVRDDRFRDVQAAETAFDAARAEYDATVADVIAAEETLQRLNDEHTPDVETAPVTPPLGPNG